MDAQPDSRASISHAAASLAPLLEQRAKVALTPRSLAEMTAKAQAFGPGTARRLNRCMMIQYDAEQHKWKDALRRTPSKGTRHVDLKGVASKVAARAHGRVAPTAESAIRQAPDNAPHRAHYNHVAMMPAVAARMSESPLFIGLMLTVAPPVGVTLAWASPRLSNSAKIALTAFGGLVMLLASVMAILVVIR